MTQYSILKYLMPVVLCLSLFGNAYHAYHQHHASLEIPPPFVTISHPILKKIQAYITQTGNTVAYNSVDLVARIEGYLQDISFTDGSYVQKDTLLFTIEPEPYLAKLNEAKATLAAQEAIHTYDQTEYERQKRMYQDHATSLNNVEKWFAKSQESVAEVAKAKENLTIAQINYGYTHVLAPFEGRIGRHLIDKNNLVGNGVATELANIEQIDPIYVYFNINEMDLMPLRIYAKAKGMDEAVVHHIPVIITLNTGQSFNGQLDFINTSLDASTGTLELRAILKNPDHILLPGLFVQVQIPIGTPEPQKAIPDTAIQYDQIGPYILTMNAQHIVELKRVTLGQRMDGYRAITQGVELNDNVIIAGLQNATPGNPVQPHFETLS